MGWTIVRRVLSVFVVLWMTAVGGILGANLLAVIGTQFFVPENKGVYVEPWSHAGWYAGTLLAFVGAITGRLRFLNAPRGDRRSTRTAEESTAAHDGAVVSAKSEGHRKSSSALAFVLMGGWAGGFLGLLLGANLLTFWFSFAYSPFAPKQAASSVEVVHERQPGSVVRRPVLRSSHRVSLYLCLAPVAVGILAGAAAAGIVVLKYRDESAA